ncbi:carboxypeptidase-like regulatory domain-containing protein, partial [bacterium]|nr:carboxypeptidase-like regulatory domain-containing protein [bacterium]
MRIFTTFLFQLVFFSGASGSAFLFSNIVYPIQSALDRAPLQMPSMKLNFSEFSPAFAAFEDEYYIATFKEEEIPSKVNATELRTSDKEIIKSEVQELNIPQMTMRPTENVDGIMNVAGLARVQRTEIKPEEQKQITAEELLLAQKSNPGLVTPILSHYWIQGKIELTEGLAISDPRDKLSVGWFVDGERKKEGRVFHQDGTYELKIDRLEGEMIAELTDRRGFLLGEAIIDLDVLKKQRAINGYVISGVDLKIKPYNFSFRGQTLSVYDTSSNRQVVVGAEVRVGGHDLKVRSDGKGQFSEPVLSPQSTGVVTAQQAKYRETTVLANFDRELSIHLFPDQFLEAFFNTIDLPSKMRTDGVIWGTITSNQQPAQGYQVRMTQQNAKPIYFEMYIANTKTEKTGIDGQFAFVGLADGEYEIEVVDQLGRAADSKLAVVRAGTVTEMNFEVADDRKIALRAFDPLSLTPKNVEFFALGQNTTVETKTEEIIKLKT